MAQSAAVRTADFPRTSPPIDLVQLATNTLGNRDLEIQVLQMFKSQASNMLARLIAEADRNEQKRLVHTMKGSARAIGAVTVAHECERAEQQLAGPDAPSFAKLQAAISLANAYIDDLTSS
ncbi:Hpt protein [Roseibium sp. TrichSKD4]|uniref:Hpt domain-containing protein n=1 Tax=Roseibium sp. TrichSKD4 TaxID=744980 RepID=UPI0001E57450|nr:Hpt domain-containing protein [Roseibium sp. TrichSKD4]EFO30802.1 Hpt protein [Roseibium sp. TrichSKD4]